MHLHHGLVPSQGQQHAGAQLVLSQRQQELLGLVAGAHQDVHLEENKTSSHKTIGATALMLRFQLSDSPCWRTAPRHHRRPRPLDCKAETSRLYLSAH